MRNKGFTLVEVVITIVIVSILSIAGTAVYRRHLDNAKYTEGMTLIQSIKEQEDLALAFRSSDTAHYPFKTTDTLIVTTFTFDRNAQNLGKFHIYPHKYKYFTSFEIRKPTEYEISNYGIVGHGYVVEAYYPQKQEFKLKIKLIGSSEGSYHIVKERGD